MKKIGINCPDVYTLLKELEVARSTGDQQTQKKLRSILRKKGFYLSRLSVGEDPFVHWSLCNKKEPLPEADPEEVLLSENEVVEHLSRWLQNNGWEVITQCLGHQHGIDILAIQNTQTMIVEAKGARGDKSSPVTRRKKFSSGQIKTHFGKALVKCFEEKCDNLGAIIAIAQPNSPYIRHCLERAVQEAIKIGIWFYWVDADGSVVIEKS